jgi:hypothetical protein
MEVSAKEKPAILVPVQVKNKHPGFGHDDLNRGLVWGKKEAKRVICNA